MTDSARWEGFPFRESDIIISTPSKCGTTWVQMICALLVFQTPNFHRPLTEISPWFDLLMTDRSELIAAIEAQAHRRFIKTHTPLDGLPFDDQVTYVCIARDPRDVGFSWANHAANLNMDALFAAQRKATGLSDLDALMPDGAPELPPTEIERFWKWVDGTSRVPGSHANLARLFHHVRTFWPAMTGAPNLVLLHYDDLQVDPEGQMRYLAQRLSISVPEKRWPELVSAAQFNEMRRRADELAGGVLLRDSAKFFNRGISGQWRTRLNEDDLRRYYRRVDELGDPEVARWVHRNP